MDKFEQIRRAICAKSNCPIMSGCDTCYNATVLLMQGKADEDICDVAPCGRSDHLACRTNWGICPGVTKIIQVGRAVLEEDHENT